MYWLLRIVLSFFGSLPLKWTQKFASMLGVLVWHLSPERRKVAIVNAEIIGSETPEKTAKQSFKHTFMSYFETAYAKNFDKKFVEKYVTIENPQYYKQLVDAGQKFIFISAHIGSWDLAAPAYTVGMDAKAIIVGRETNSKTVNKLIDYMRNSGNIIYVQQHGFLDKMKEYEDYTPGSLLDHIGIGKDVLFAPFFGYRVETLIGSLVMAARKNIPLLPAYLIRTENGFLFTMNEAIYPNTELKPKERIYDLAVRMNEEYERIIRKYPEQWYLLHRRFKRVEEADGKSTRSVYR